MAGVRTLSGVRPDRRRLVNSPITDFAGDTPKKRCNTDLHPAVYMPAYEKWASPPVTNFANDPSKRQRDTEQFGPKPRPGVTTRAFGLPRRFWPARSAPR